MLDISVGRLATLVLQLASEVSGSLRGLSP